MGSAMAKELVAAGYTVHLWNRNKQIADDLANTFPAGHALSHKSVKDALISSEIAICVFANGQVTSSVLLEDTKTLDSLEGKLTIVDMGTSGVETAHFLQKSLKSRSIAFVDAPVSGSVATIAAHQLLVMASGDEEDVKKIEPVFNAFAKKVLYLGEAGSGQAMKLAVNLIVHTLSAGVSEALALACANGISSTTAYDVFEESVVAAPFVKYKRGAFLDPSSAVAMRIDTSAKDLSLIVGLGDSSQLALGVAGAVRDLYERAETAGYGSSDMAALFRYLQG